MVAHGRLVNLAGGDGHPVEIMDLTFAVQALAAHAIAADAGRFEPGLRPIPAEIDELVARAKLATLGVEPDAFTAEQLQYLKSWR